VVKLAGRTHFLSQLFCKQVMSLCRQLYPHERQRLALYLGREGRGWSECLEYIRRQWYLLSSVSHKCHKCKQWQLGERNLSATRFVICESCSFSKCHRSHKNFTIAAIFFVKGVAHCAHLKYFSIEALLPSWANRKSDFAMLTYTRLDNAVISDIFLSGPS
jgi:hypothetical protein